MLEKFYVWCDKHFWVYWTFTFFAVAIETTFMNTAKYFPEIYLVIGMNLAYFVSSFCLKRIGIAASAAWWEVLGNIVVIFVDLIVLKTITEISNLELIAILVGLTAIILIICFNERITE